jgi:hypothetical protein
MGFRNPITTAVDPVARQAASDAETDAARALTEIIPGSRLAVDALDFKTAVGMTLSAATVTGALIRATGTGDVTATSTGHALQAGPTSGGNVVVDGNEIMARNNGTMQPLFLNDPRGKSLQTAQPNALTRRDYVDGKTASGLVTITPSAANTPTSASVSFGKTFSAPPTVVCTAASAVVGTTVTGVGATRDTTPGVTCDSTT